MIELYKGLNDAYESGQQNLIRLRDKKHTFGKITDSLYYCFESSAWYNVLRRQNIDAAKQDFYNCGLADIEHSKNGGDIFGYKRDSPLYAALSDNCDLIAAFKDIEYTLRGGPQAGKTNKELAKAGKGHLYIDTIIKTMNRDEKGLRSNLKIMENVFFKLKKNATLKVDYEFFKGILKRDKDVVFEAIHRLSTKDHKRRNKNSFYMKNLISQPAMGYAKIAWINELELEFESPLILNELLPVKPAKNYQDRVQPYKILLTD